MIKQQKITDEDDHLRNENSRDRFLDCRFTIPQSIAVIHCQGQHKQWGYIKYLHRKN